MEKLLDFYYSLLAYWESDKKYIMGAFIGILGWEFWNWFWALF